MTVLLCLKILVISPTLPFSRPAITLTVSPIFTCIFCKTGRLFGLHSFRSHRLSWQRNNRKYYTKNRDVSRKFKIIMEHLKCFRLIINSKWKQQFIPGSHLISLIMYIPSDCYLVFCPYCFLIEGNNNTNLHHNKAWLLHWLSLHIIRTSNDFKLIIQSTLDSEFNFSYNLNNRFLGGNFGDHNELRRYNNQKFAKPFH